MSCRIVWRQSEAEKLRDPRFYDLGLCCVVSDGSRDAEIWCDGLVRWRHEDGREISFAIQFRRAFADGVVPADGEDGWERIDDDRRFDVVMRPRGGELSVQNLDEAVAVALAHVGHPLAPAARRGGLLEALARRPPRRSER